MVPNGLLFRLIAEFLNITDFVQENEAALFGESFRQAEKEFLKLKL